VIGSSNLGTGVGRRNAGRRPGCFGCHVGETRTTLGLLSSSLSQAARRCCACAVRRRAQRSPAPPEPPADHRVGWFRQDRGGVATVADPLAERKIPAEGIVGLAFTERAAAELKERIIGRVEGRDGS